MDRERLLSSAGASEIPRSRGDRVTRRNIARLIQLAVGDRTTSHGAPPTGLFDRCVPARHASDGAGGVWFLGRRFHYPPHRAEAPRRVLGRPVTGRLRGTGVGTLWLGATTILTRGSHMMVAVVLAAFLSPADLGLVALAVTLFNVGAVLQAMGVHDVIARTAQDPDRMAATVMSLSVGLGAVLALLGVLLAEPLATLLGEPTAAPLVRLAVAPSSPAAW